MCKKKKARFVPAAAVFVLAALVSPACSRQSGGAETGNELRYGFAAEPATLDPLDPKNTADGRSILFNVFEGLVKPDTEGRLLPCVAESWTIEQGGRVYVFSLREGLRFHDGSTLSAADVEFSLNTAADAGFEGFGGIEKIETPNDHEVRITLKNPDPEFLPYLTVGIVKAGSSGRDKKAVGSGPYSIESWTVQQSIVMRKFSAYRNAAPRGLEKITLVFLPDSASLILGLRGGSIDGAGLTGALAQQLDPSAFDIVPGFSAMVQLLALNNGVKPLDDVRVRQAVNYAVDIQEIIDTAFYGQGKPSGSPLIPGLSLYYEQSLANPRPRDLDKARSLLSGAGWGDGGRRLSLEITVPSNYTMHVDTAQVIANQLGKIGISVSIRQIDWAAWLSDVYRGRKYQATVISLDAATVSPRGFLSRYRSGADSNFINFHSAEFDRIYDAAVAEPDEEKRIALYKEAQRIVSANAASVFIQDIMGFKAFRRGAFGGVLNYPVYVNDFASMYRTGQAN
jgi:peptide/nickel transport system substrate-binding protein